MKNYKSLLLLFFALLFFGSVYQVSGNSMNDNISETEVLSEINYQRAKAGLSMLSQNLLLKQAADRKVQDMIDNLYFDHTSPSGIQPWDWLEDSGYQYVVAGENLAMNFSDSFEMVESWMSSESHRENLLNKNYEDYGISFGKYSDLNHSYTFAVLLLASKK